MSWRYIHDSRGVEPQPPGEWAWRCACGWTSVPEPTIKGARLAFSVHLDLETCARLLGDLRCTRERVHAGGCVFVSSSKPNVTASDQ